MALSIGGAPAGPDPANSTPLPASQCRTVADLERTLAHLSHQDTIITDRLNSLLSMQEDLTRSLARLDLLRAHLGTQVVSARSLSTELLSPTASTASRVSSAVKALDIEQSRVKATLAVVDQVSELKACILGLTGSMGSPQDWETAAAYLHRASKIPQEIITGAFAEEIVPSTEVPDPPAVTLHNAAESLCGLFLREFERAAKATPPDGEKITRFFKLFPLIGRAETGLDIYGKYVCTGISARARATLASKSDSGSGGPGGGGAGAFFYANAMTRLFEHIAGIIEQHSPLVERHYGRGKMGRVIQRVQSEADIQGGIIIDAFGEEREIDRKITETKSYAFTFLVQSFLPGSRNPAVGPQRTGSPAAVGGTGAGGTGGQADSDGMDVKEIDMTLLEIGAMLSRWALYCRFMARKFLTLTTFFFRRTLEKAFQLDEPPSDLLPLPLFNPSLPHPSQSHAPGPFITSSVDDIMFILTKLLHRTLTTSQPSLVHGIISTLSRILASDFLGLLQRKMRDECYPRPAATTTTIIIGNPIATLAQSMSNIVDDRTVQFLVLVNNIDVAIEYLKRIVSNWVSPPTPKTHTVILKQLLNDSVLTLFNQLIKAKLRPLITEAFRDVDYNNVQPTPVADPLDIDGLGDGGEQELVKARFQLGWGALVHPFKYVLTEGPFNKLLTHTAMYLARLLEKKLASICGADTPSSTTGTAAAAAAGISELGAIRLERDVAGIVGVVVKAGRYNVREAFARCVQICLVMNVEEDEVGGLWEEGAGGGGLDVEWKLSVEERRRWRAMVRR
ncbi:COG4 transport protein-domain-containing protein [Kalaharituber pfeilii]|nr:COG4 transport protein-domain-containing protein [Kalaharituber pfeilii]